MATKYFLGNEAGHEGDWSRSANHSPSGVPADGDTSLVVSGTQGVTAGFAQSAVTLAKLSIGGSLSDCNIGESGTPLTIGATQVVIQTKNSVGVYLAGATGSDDPLALTIVECQDADAEVELSGDLTTIILRRGKLKVTGVFVTLIVEPLNGDASNCSWDIAAATGTLIVNDGGIGGVSSASANISTLKAYGNSMTIVQEGTTANIETAGNANVIHNAPTAVTSIVSYGLSKVDTTQDQRPKTVGTWTKSWVSTALVGENVTLTNPIKGLAGDDLKSSNPYGIR